MASSKQAIYAAIGGNFAIAVTKFIGATISGSSAMLAEGIHSLVDTGNGGLLLLGLKRSKRPPDDDHPYGYGKSLYFYTLIVAILIFGLGGGISIYEGLLHALHAPEHYEASQLSVFGLTFSGLTLNTVVLTLGIVFESYALATAYRAFKKVKKPDEGFIESIRNSKDPTTFTVLFEDTAAISGLIVALVGIYLAYWLDMPVLDGVASIVIGVILCLVASFLIWESKGLLLGESADPEIRRDVKAIAQNEEGVVGIGRIMTMHVGPDDILLNMQIEFQDDLRSDRIEDVIDRLEQRILQKHEEISHIFIEAESLSGRARKQKAVAQSPTDGEGARQETTRTTKDATSDDAASDDEPLTPPPG